MKRRLNQTLVVAAGFILSGACLFFFARRVTANWPQVVETFRRANYLCLIPAVGFIGVLYLLRVVRWQLLLRPIKRVGMSSAASATCIGFMSNNILPARLGEIIRPYVLHRREDVSFGHAFATVGAARVFDLVGLSILLLITWVLMTAHAPGAQDRAQASARAETSVELTETAADLEAGETARTIRTIWRVGTVFVGVAAVGCVVLIGLALFPRPLLRMGELCTQILPAAWREAANRFLRSITEAMRFVKDWKGVMLAVVYSVGVWVAQGLSTYVLALGLGVNLGVAGAFFVVIAVAVAVALPQAPGYIGPFQLAAAVAAEAFQAGAAEAQALALLMWLVNVLPITLVGLGFLWHEGLKLGDLTAASRALNEAPPEA